MSAHEYSVPERMSKPLLTSPKSPAVLQFMLSLTLQVAVCLFPGIYGYRNTHLLKKQFIEDSIVTKPKTSYVAVCLFDRIYGYRNTLPFTEEAYY